MDKFLEVLEHEFHLPLGNPVLVFSLILFIILIAPHLFKRLNIPGVIVLIVSGIIIGPFGLGILEENAAIELFSTIGLIYIMFIAGLELDMNEFKVNKHKSLLFGIFTFVLPLSIGFPVVHYLLGYDFNTSFLTASMFATHTLLAYPVVSRLGVAKDQAIAITVGGTILTDTAVLIVLAIILGNAQEGGLTMDFWVRLVISLAIFSAIIFMVIPKVAKWFFTTMEKDQHSHYIFVLAMVFFASFLAELAGVEPIIGAFLAGLALNGLIPHSSALMNRIEFLGNSLFIPFFLISVGMLVDVSIILEGWNAIIVALTLSVVAICGKWVAAFLTQQVFRYSPTQRKMIFGLSSGHAAATLAVIMVGYEAEILDITILNGTIILILITSIVSTLVTENAAKKMVKEEENEDLNSARNSSTFKKESILLPIANIINFDKLLEFAILVKDKASNNPVRILTVVPNNEEAELNIAQANNKLEGFVRQASASETEVKIISTIDQSISVGISRASKEHMADLLILGWPNTSGIINRVVGSKMEKIVRSTNKTIFICHLLQPWATHKRLYVAVPPLVDQLTGFELWLKKSIRLSKELSAEMIVHCDEQTRQSIEEMIKRLNLKAPIVFNPFDDWDDFLYLAKDMHEDDVLMVVSARKTSPSYHAYFEKLPGKLDKYFKENSKIIVYPQD